MVLKSNIVLIFIKNQFFPQTNRISYQEEQSLVFYSCFCFQDINSIITGISLSGKDEQQILISF